MLRPNDKSRRIADQVMDLAQRYGADISTLEGEEISFERFSKKPSKGRKKENFTGFLEIETGQ